MSKHSKEKKRKEMEVGVPANISCDDQVYEVDFHPNQPLLAAALITGAVELWNYSKERKNTKHHSASLFPAACRGVQFTESGSCIYAISADNSWKIYDIESQQTLLTKKDAHTSSINKCLILRDNLFITGDDKGIVKLWDNRTASSYQETMSWDAHTDYITAFDYSLDNEHHVLSAAGDATLCIYDIRNQSHFYKSDDQESEIHAITVMKNGKKVYCGTQEGPMLIFKWGKWEDCVDRFVGHTDGIESMIKIDENTLITGTDEGSLRLVSLSTASPSIDGVIGDLDGLSVEGLKLDSTGSLLAAISLDENIRFWDISEFIDNVEDDDEDDENNEDENHDVDDGERHDDSVSEEEDNNEGEDSASGDEGDFEVDDSDEEVEDLDRRRVNIVEDEEEVEESSGPGEEDSDENVEESESENESEQEEGENNKKQKGESESDSDEEEDNDRRPKKRIKTEREKFYADL
jgi:WD40 repeat protein